MDLTRSRPGITQPRLIAGDLHKEPWLRVSNDANLTPWSYYNLYQYVDNAHAA